MRVTVLGGCGAWPEAGRAAAGFLIEQDGFMVALDLGYATLPNLLRIIPPERLDAVLITHEHPDHCADLHPLHRAWRMRVDSLPPLRVYCPDGVLARIEGLEGGEDVAELRPTLEVRPLAPGVSFALGPWRVSSRFLPHWVPNAGLRLDADEVSIAYTGDTGPSEEIIDLAAGASLFIADATWPGHAPAHIPRYDLTATEAGRYAAEAGVERLLLTHFWPGTDRSRSVAAACAHYDRDIMVADEGVTISVPPR